MSMPGDALEVWCANLERSYALESERARSSSLSPVVPTYIITWRYVEKAEYV